MPEAKTRIARLEPFIGVWNTHGEVLQTDLNPAGELIATDTYRWLPGRHFIAHEVDARCDGEPTRSLEIIGYDATKRQYFSHSYGDQGVSERFSLTLAGRRWNIEGNSVRFTGRFDADWTRLTGTWQLKVARSRWQDWIRLELLRA